MRKITVILVLSMVNIVSLTAQNQPDEVIETSDGNTYIGQVVMETEDVVKMIIKKKTVVNIDKSRIVHRDLANDKKRNHTFSAELSTYYLLPVGLNYDFNIYRFEDYLIGGTLGVGVAGVKVGTYGAYRLSWQDLLKAEVGIGSTAHWSSTYTGVYGELAYRSQRDNRAVYWELGVGSMLDLSERNGFLRHINIGVGFSF